MVIEGAKLRLRGFDSWVVNHICKNKNSVAHIMAQNARFVYDVVMLIFGWKTPHLLLSNRFCMMNLN